MKIAKSLLTRSQQARVKAEAESEPGAREYWLGLSRTWQAMSEIHTQDLDSDFDKIQIEAVRARVAETRARVHEQMQRIEDLRRLGAMTPSANGLLHTLCESLSLHCECLERLTRDYRKRRPR